MLAICPTTGRPMLLGRAAPTALGDTPKAAARFTPPPARTALPTADKPTRDLIGVTVGRKYVIRAILGEGGMGTVYEAEHLAIGRAVAVKVLHPQQMRKSEAVKRFHHEARAAGAIGHPNICEVYDLGTLDDGRPYLVMEKLVGKTLSDRIKEDGGLPLDEVADVLTQVLSGLVAAHAKGILHRDIKPENVFLASRVGCPAVAKLLDFGVSKIVAPLGQSGSGERDEEMDLTRTGMVMGTPYYMSPEQARGDRNLDGRVDIYACGVLAYEAVTGRRPFVANNYHALLLQILDSKLKSPRELRPDLSPAFTRIIEKAMSRKREDRYANATEFQFDLQRLGAAEPPLARTTAGQPRRPLMASPDAPAKPVIVELPSDALDAPSSVNIPVARGFDDLPTEMKLTDFSLSDDDEAATTLMHDDEIRVLKSRSREASLPPAPLEPFDADVTTRVSRDPPASREPLLRRPPAPSPSPRRAPKAR
jgi:serine/threonine-protein kinase